MEADNLEISLFLRRLKAILGRSTNQLDLISKDSLNLVVTILTSYENQHPSNSSENDIRNLTEDTSFVFKRNIHCRCCDVSMMKLHSLFKRSMLSDNQQKWRHFLYKQKSFAMTQAAFNIHVASEQHKNGGTTTNTQEQIHETSGSPERSESSLNTNADSINSFDPTKTNDFFKLVKFEANNLANRSNARAASEKKIIEVVTKYVMAYNLGFNVHQYGSTIFGFGGSVDLNIWVDTCKEHIFNSSGKFVYFK